MSKLDDFKRFQISVGRGNASFPMSRGSFKYKENLEFKDDLMVSNPMETENGIEFQLSSKKGNVVGKASIRESNGEYLFSYDLNDKSLNRFWITVPTNEKEHIYGCGETFSEFDLKGQNIRIWVAEHQNANRIGKKMIREKIIGKRPERKLPFSKYESYYVQPTFVSSDKYYVHVDGSSYMEFDFRKSNQITLYMRGIHEIHIGTGKSFEEISFKLSNLLGRQRKLPDWLFDGVILAIQEGTDTIQKKLDEAKKHKIPVAGVWSQDWSGCRRTGFGYQVMWNWQWDKELYPNLDQKIKEWKEDGIRFLGYINPFIAIEKELYQIASKEGYCVKDKEGNDYLVTITTFPAAMVDFTNPKAYEWYKGLIKENMIGLGMGGWMADFGEYLPPDCVLYSGEDPELIHNEWPAIWAKMNHEAIVECGVEDEVFFFTRAGFTGTIKHSTMMWNGDQHVDWSIDDGLPSVIPATLSLAMSGYGITHSDAGGYTTVMHMRRDQELLMRWEEMNVFSPLFRTHEGNQPVNDVQYDANPELLDFMSRMASIHKSLKSYLTETIDLQISEGIPVMRPLFYHYDEEKAYTEMYEYLLGRDILVCPVLKQGAKERNCYLPNDEWVHFFTKETYMGGSHIVDAEIGCPPVFVRKNSTWGKKLLGIV